MVTMSHHSETGFWLSFYRCNASNWFLCCSVGVLLNFESSLLDVKFISKSITKVTDYGIEENICRLYYLFFY